jgi:DNA-binding MurR/RpiR family transcriptional regulator
VLSFAPSPSYADRIRPVQPARREVDSLSPHELLQEFADSNVVALQHLKQSIRRADLEKAVTLIRDADCVTSSGSGARFRSRRTSRTPCVTSTTSVPT